jgi:hypothetical protein
MDCHKPIPKGGIPLLIKDHFTELDKKLERKICPQAGPQRGTKTFPGIREGFFVYKAWARSLSR